MSIRPAKRLIKSKPTLETPSADTRTPSTDPGTRVYRRFSRFTIQLVVAYPFEVVSPAHLRLIGSHLREWRMTKMVANPEDNRFRSGVEKYAAYLETPEGRLRLDLAFATLQDFLPQATRSLLALDVGGGTGAIAVRLARLGLHVTLLDSSLPMLDFAKRAAQEAGVAERITLNHGDAVQLANSFPAASFDVILCHNILEYVDDPCAVLRSAACTLRDPSSIISVLVRNQAGEVLKAAIEEGDLAASEHNLTAEWGHESLYGGRVRLFTAESLQAMLLESSLAVTAERGVRVISDYLPLRVSRNDEYDRIFRLERKLGRRPEFVSVARYTHCVAQRAGPGIQGGA
jgi:S-adenosylmethionine-dependent methyltransferase